MQLTARVFGGAALAVLGRQRPAVHALELGGHAAHLSGAHHLAAQTQTVLADVRVWNDGALVMDLAVQVALQRDRPRRCRTRICRRDRLRVTA